MTRLRDGLCSHWPLAILVGVAVFLRLLIGAVYGAAFWFPDTEGYFDAARDVEPYAIRPYGYSALLNIFEPFGSVWPIIIAQHLMGVGCAIAVYAFVLRKGGARWLATLAAVPLLFDAHELVVEHYLISDTLFTAFLLGGLMALMWEDKLSVRNASIGGLLWAAAILTRTVGLPLVLLVGLYVLIRRVGWRQIFAVAAAAGIPLIGYLFWFNHHNGAFSFSTWQDRWMYGRVMSIADCDMLELSTAEQKLCQRAAAPHTYNVNYYVWSTESPVNDEETGTNRRDVYTFIGAVIMQQPGDFTALVARETWAFFSPQFYLQREEPLGTTCPGLWEFPQTVSDPACAAQPVSSSQFGSYPGEHPDSWSGTLVSFFSTYSRVAITPGPFLLLCLLLVPVAVFRRGGAWRLKGDALFLGGCGFALLGGAIATSQFDIRYGLPALALLPLAGAFAWISLRSGSAPSASNDGGTECPRVPTPTDPPPKELPQKTPGVDSKAPVTTN